MSQISFADAEYAARGRRLGARFSWRRWNWWCSGRRCSSRLSLTTRWPVADFPDHCRAQLYQERRRRAGSGDAPDQEGRAVVLRHQGTHWRGRRQRPGAHGDDHAGQRVGCRAGCRPAARHREKNLLGRLLLSRSPEPLGPRRWRSQEKVPQNNEALSARPDQPRDGARNVQVS